MFGLGKKEPKAPKLPKYLAAIHMNHVEGLEQVPYNESVGLHVRPGETYIEMEYEQERNLRKILLLFSQIIQVNIITWEKTIVKELNPLAEGIVGGMIGGHTMAVVSAIDAKGRTRSEKVKVENALEIQYHPKGDFRNVESLIFRSRMTKSMTLKFAKTLCKYANLPGPNFIEPKPQGPQYL